jgi:hypothetical protein
MKKPTTAEWKKQIYQLDREKKAMLKPLKKYILRGYGRRCKEFAWGCSTCDAWLAYDILDS